MANLPVPVPRTFSVAETETGSYMNTIRDGLNFLLNPPMAIIYQSVAQTFTSGATAALTFDATAADTYGGHSNVTNNTRYTAQVAGWYFAKGGCVWATNASGNRAIQISKNGTPVIESWMAVTAAGTFNAPGVETSTLVFLNVGDYIELLAAQNSGGNLNTFVGGPNSALQIWWVHA